MKTSTYFIFIISLLILSLGSIYNFMHPIKNIDNEPEVFEGKILGITQEAEYNEQAEYTYKYVAEVLTQNKNEHIGIELSKEQALQYKENDKINYYENKGEYLITDKEKTLTNGGIAWIILAVVEICTIIFLTVKKFKK